MAIINNNDYWYSHHRDKNGKVIKTPIKGPDGKTPKVIYRNRRDNRSEVETYLKSKVNGPGEGISASNTTIDDFMPIFKAYLIDKGLKRGSLSAYTQNVEEAKNYLPQYIQEIRLEHIETFMEQLTWKPITKVKYAKSLSRFFDVAKRKGMIEKNPIEGFEFPQFKPNVIPFTEEQIKRIIEASRELEEKLKEPYYPFTIFAFQTGLRLDEYRNLRWEQLNINKRTYSITETDTFDPKHSHSRIITVPRKSIELLKNMKQKNEGFIFCNQSGNAYTHFARDFSNAIFQASGVSGDLHQIRKTLASYRLACGQPIQNLKEHLGHKSIKELETYVGKVMNVSKYLRDLFGDF